MPVPLVIVICTPPPTLAQAPDALNVTLPVPLPPLAPTLKLEPNAADAGALITLSAACGSLASDPRIASRSKASHA